MPRRQQRKHRYLVGHGPQPASYSLAMTIFMCALTHAMFVYITYPDIEKYPAFKDSDIFTLYELLILAIATEVGFVVYTAIPEFSKALAYDAELIRLGFRYFVPENPQPTAAIPTEYIFDETATNAITERLNQAHYENDIPKHFEDMRTGGLIATPIRLIVKNKYDQLEPGHVIDLELYRSIENQAKIKNIEILCPHSRQPIIGYQKDVFAKNQIERWLQTLEMTAKTAINSSATKVNHQDIPISFCDPLDDLLMENPIKLIITLKNKKLQFGCTLDKRSLDKILKQKDLRCPRTKQYVVGYDKDFFMAEEIERYLKNNPQHKLVKIPSTNLYQPPRHPSLPETIFSAFKNSLG